jgi:exodeoxyribonuclease V alpha subunit
MTQTGQETAAWASQEIFSAIDRRFADMIARLSGVAAPELWLAAALASNTVQNGHVCVDLRSAAGTPLGTGERPGECGPVCPPWPAWADLLRATSAVGAPGDFRPLILDPAGRLYLYRYWHYEKVLIDFIRTRAIPFTDRPGSNVVAESLARLFPEPGPHRTAASATITRPLAVITGGPGTGKTSAVVKILALLLEHARGERFRVALAAPTGKAAARLRDSVKKAKEGLDCSPEIRARIPEEASTLHRLLGSIPHSARFRFDAGNPLPLDAVVVDEASMVDLPLMAKLVQALPAECRLVLLGDKDQLASVQPGAVFGDICGGGRNGAPALSSSIVTLHKSYRFGEASGIGRASRQVNAGDGAAALETASGAFRDISWKDLPAPGALEAALQSLVLAGYGPYLAAATPEEAFQAFGRFRVLCAVRQGPFGVDAVNEAIIHILWRARLIGAAERWFPGQPVLITRNDYRLRLFNGDIGLVVRDGQEGSTGTTVLFPSEGGTFRRIHPMRLPDHETVYAMTVHKSQGSEFDHILMVLPPVASPVLTRELIYTGLTRAVRRVDVWGDRGVFIQAAGRRTDRASGLRDALWPSGPEGKWGGTGKAISQKNLPF